MYNCFIYAWYIHTYIYQKGRQIEWKERWYVLQSNPYFRWINDCVSSVTSQIWSLCTQNKNNLNPRAEKKQPNILVNALSKHKVLILFAPVNDSVYTRLKTEQQLLYFTSPLRSILSSALYNITSNLFYFDLNKRDSVPYWKFIIFVQFIISSQESSHMI